MSQEQWSDVSSFLDKRFPQDPALEAALEASVSGGLPAISISAAEGRLLHLLARCLKARYILEVGTLGGYSSIWLASALPPGGRLVTLELERKHADVASANIKRAGLLDRVEIRVGPALATLPKLLIEHPDGFDLVFIDADKTGYPDYWSWALKLSHPGTLIIADNVVRDGKVADLKSEDKDVRAVQQYLSLAGAEPRVHTTVMQTVGPKGYDGMALSLVLGGA
jgi:predicted O-methyltransferase YrrM